MTKLKINYINWKGKSESIDESKWSIDDMIPIKETSDGHMNYVVLSDVKKMCENNNLSVESFYKWMTGQTMPVITEEGDDKFNCFYPADLERWVKCNLMYNKNPIVLD